MKKRSFYVKRTLDVILTGLLLLLMSYQVTGDLWHEWIGVIMTVLVIVHHIINIRWYTSLFKGRYTGYRIAVTAVDFFLLISFALSALSGMSMSAYAVPFLNGLMSPMTAVKLHLGMSCWSFVLMSLHIGLHLRPVFRSSKVSPKGLLILRVVAAVLGVAGLIFFVLENMPAYMLFRQHFAIHSGGPAVLTLLKNILMMMPWIAPFTVIGSTAGK